MFLNSFRIEEKLSNESLGVSTLEGNLEAQFEIKTDGLNIMGVGVI